ncbi:MAG: hypothetical protein ACI4DK_05220 [Lachnospiraceae bacterium]
MKKKSVYISILLILIIGGIGVILGKTLICDSLKGLNPIIISCYSSDSDGHVNGGTIYSYDVEKKEKENIGNIALDNISYDGKNLVGVQNNYPDSIGFKGIITYDIHTQEITEILPCSRIYEMLDEKNHLFTGNIQMNSNADIMVFACGGKMFMYSINEDELAELFSTSSNQYILSSDGTCLYFSENSNLYSYNFMSGKKEVMLEGVYNFAISSDEKTIVYENQKEEMIYLYIVETQENKEIIKLNESGGNMYFSKDNGYLLFTDRKSSFVPTNYKIQICIYDIANSKISVVYRGKYEDNYRNVIW